MHQPSHAQMDDIQDAIDMAGLVEAALRVYPDLVAQAGVTSSALDAIGEIAFDRHHNESVARFRENPGRFLRSGEMVDIGPVKAQTFAILVAALDAVASTGHALDELNGSRV